MSDLIFILGRQRSGTTVFRELLSTTGALNCDEIFHGDLNKDYRFYKFVLEKTKIDPQYIHPQRHSSLFKDFIEFLRKEADGRKIAMDVKYFGLNLIPSAEDIMGREPFLLRFLKQKKPNIVQITRKNKLRMFISQKIAQKTGKWSAVTSEHLDFSKPKLKINILELKNFIDLSIRNDEQTKKLVSAQEKYFHLCYEEMFLENGYFSKLVINTASKIMECNIIDAKPANLKMNPETLVHLVENYQEINEFLNGTKHQWMLEID